MAPDFPSGFQGSFAFAKFVFTNAIAIKIKNAIKN